MARTRVALVLSGCGVQDGSEIHEAVLALLALDRLDCEVVCAAPDVAQKDVVDHRTGKATKEKRNVLAESARIARGNVVAVATLKADALDAVVLPGGYGAAKNLCSFAAGTADWTVEAETARLLKEMHAARKPIGAMCIAPVVLARLFGDEKLTLTIGSDAATAARIAAKGARHQECRADQIVIDEEARVVTTPAYMLAQGIAEAARGIDKLCQAVVDMAR